MGRVWPWPVLFLNFTTVWDLLQKESDTLVASADGPSNLFSFQPTSLLKEIEKVDVLLAESNMSGFGTTTSKPQLALRWVLVRRTQAAGSPSLASHPGPAMKQAAWSVPARHHKSELVHGVRSLIHRREPTGWH